MPWVEPKAEPDATTPAWPPKCAGCGRPTEPVEELLAGRYRLQRPKYRFWCAHCAETDKREN